MEEVFYSIDNIDYSIDYIAHRATCELKSNREEIRQLQDIVFADNAMETSNTMIAYKSRLDECYGIGSYILQRLQKIKEIHRLSNKEVVLDPSYGLNEVPFRLV